MNKKFFNLILAFMAAVITILLGIYNNQLKTLKEEDIDKDQDEKVVDCAGKILMTVKLATEQEEEFL